MACLRQYPKKDGFETSLIIPQTFLSGSRDNPKAVFLITTLTAAPPEVKAAIAKYLRKASKLVGLTLPRQLEMRDWSAETRAAESAGRGGVLNILNPGGGCNFSGAGTSNSMRFSHLSTARTHLHFLAARDTVEQVCRNRI